jgi:hypothetical protein
MVLSRLSCAEYLKILVMSCLLCLQITTMLLTKLLLLYLETRYHYTLRIFSRLEQSNCTRQSLRELNGRQKRTTTGHDLLLYFHNMALPEFRWRLYPADWTPPPPDTTIVPDCCTWRRPICKAYKTHDHKSFYTTEIKSVNMARWFPGGHRRRSETCYERLLMACWLLCRGG